VPISGITTDQRGIARPSSTPDVGAYQGQGFKIVIVSGNNQSALLNTSFAKALVVKVVPNDPLQPVNGGQVTFKVPASGASASLSHTTVTISGGQATVNATANGTVGAYSVVASIPDGGTTATASFTFVNRKT
jgi:hypothetical protein